MWPRRICVVGGGTAGWLAAMMLGESATRGGHACDVMVIESSKIGTIGVGEGTTAFFRQMLQHFGLDEAEFLAATTNQSPPSTWPSAPPTPGSGP